jgi:hypothetical protein
VPDPLPTLPSAIASFHLGEVDGGILMRAVVRWNTWLVPVEPTPQGTGRVRAYAYGSDSVIHVFTDMEHMLAYAATGGAVSPAQSTGAAPVEVIAALEKADAVVVNPGSDQQFEYRAEQAPMLRELLQAAPVEDALAGIGESPDALDIIAAYPHFWLVFARSGDQAEFGLAPDDAGRKLLAAFTATDARDRYLDVYGEDLGIEPLVFERNGRQLMEQVKDLQVDGVVFNCLGPPTPAAYGAVLADRIIGPPRTIKARR